MPAGPWEEYAAQSTTGRGPWEEYAPKKTSTAPIPDVIAPTVKPVSTPAADFSHAVSLPGVTNPQKTTWERTKEFVNRPLVGNIPIEGGAPNIASLEIGQGSWGDEPVTKRVSDVLAERGGGPISGVARGVGNIAAGLTSPANLAMLTGMGTLPKLAQAGIGGAFTVEQALQLPEQARAIKDTFDSPDATSGDKTQAVTELLATSALGVLGAKGAMNDFRSSPQVQAHMAPRIASDHGAAMDIGYELGGNRKTRGGARAMVENATEGAQQRMDRFALPPALPPQSTQGEVVVAAPNRPPLAQQLQESKERIAKLPKPPTLLDEVVEQPVGPAPFRKPTPGLPLPKLAEGLPPVRLTDEGSIVDPARLPTPIRRAAEPLTLPPPSNTRKAQALEEFDKHQPLAPVEPPAPPPREAPVPQQAITPEPVQLPQVVEPPAVINAPGKQAIKEPDHEFASTQVQMPPEVAAATKDIASRIDPADLADDGIENESHITVKYGLHANEPGKVHALLAGEPAIRAKIGKLSLFENDKADVLKADIESPDLHRINGKIAEAMPHTDTHPDYQPHMTIAYLKPGTGKKYLANNDLLGKEVTLDSLVFSGKDRTKTEIPLGGGSTTVEAPKSMADRLTPIVGEKFAHGLAADLDNSLPADRTTYKKQEWNKVGEIADRALQYAISEGTNSGQFGKATVVDGAIQVKPTRGYTPPDAKTVARAQEILNAALGKDAPRFTEANSKVSETLGLSDSRIDKSIASDLASSNPAKQAAAVKRLASKGDETGMWKPFAGNKANLSPSEQYALEMVERREAARRSMSKGKNRLTGVQKLWVDGKANMVDSVSPIDDVFARVMKQDKGTYSVRPSQEFETAVAKAYRAPTLAGQFAKDKGLTKLIQDLPTQTDVNNLDQLLIARHAAEIDAINAKNTAEIASATAALAAAKATKNGPGQKLAQERLDKLADWKEIKTGRDAARDAQLVTDLTPRYQKELDGIRKYTSDLMDYIVDSGLKSKKDMDALRTKYPDYADFHRVLPEALSNIKTTRGVASKSSTNVIQKLVGSDKLEIDSPLGNLLEKTHAAFLEGQQNLAARAAAEHASLPGMEKYVKPIGPKTAEKMDPKDYFTYLKDGKPQHFAAPREFVAAAKSLNAEEMGLLGKAFFNVVRVFKAGTTGIAPVFAAGNIARDQLTRSINQMGVGKTAQKALPIGQTAASKAGDLLGLHPTIAKASAEAVFNVARNFISRDSPLYDEMVRNAAGGTSFDLYRNQPVLSVRDIRAQKNPVTRTKNILRGGLREIENLIGTSEEVTRLQAYSSGKADALASGFSDADAQALGAKAARQSTADFYRGGNWKRPMMVVFPYMNAGIQGTRSGINAATKDPAGYAVRTAAKVAIPAAMLALWNMSTPERKKAWDDIQDWEKDKAFILLPDNPTKDKMGRYDAVKVPMPPGISEVGSLVRKHVEAQTGGDPVKASAYAEALFNYFSPLSGTGEQIIGQTVPQLGKPVIEAAFNKNFFTNKPVEPEWMAKKAVADRRYDTTSGTAQMISDATGVSPLKADHIMKGYGGGVTSEVLHYADVGRKAFADALPGQGPWVEYLRNVPVGGESTPAKFGRRFGSAMGGVIDDKEIAETEKSKMAVAEENSPDERMARKLFKEWQSNPATLDKAIAMAESGELSERGEDILTKLIENETSGLQKWEKNLRLQPAAVRAERILQMMKGKSDEELDALEADLTDKKILTPAVMQVIEQRTANQNQP